MKKKAKSDYILTDKIPSVLLRVSYPLIISNIIATMYSLADGVWLAQLSYTQFAATSFTWPVIFLFISVAIGLSIAGTAIISQFIGAKKRDRASDFANHLIMISIVLGLGFSVVGYFAMPVILNWMGAKGEIYDYSLTYTRVHALGFLVDTLYFSFQAILNAQGMTKHTTLMGAVSGFLNIVLDPVLIFSTIPLVGLPGFDLGVMGAALATLLAKIIALFIGGYKVFTDKTNIDVSLKGFRWNKYSVRHLVNMAIPTTIGRSSAAVGFTIMNGFIMVFGEEIVAAFSMVNRMTDLWTQISMGIGAGMTSIIGQNIGARQFDRAEETMRVAKRIVWIISIIGMILLVVFKTPLLKIFVDPAKDYVVYENAVDYLRYAIFIVPLMGLFNIYQGVFQGSGKMKYSMHMSTGRLWLVRIPMVIIFNNFTDLQQTGIWISMVASNAAIILYSAYIYRTRDIIRDQNI